jgi:hypothetical protein
MITPAPKTRQGWFAPAPTPHLADVPRRPGQNRPVLQEPRQLLAQDLGGRVAPLGFLLEALQADGLEVTRHTGIQKSQRQRFLIQHLPQGICQVFPDKRRSPGQELVKDASQGVDVAPASNPPPLTRSLFGRHEAGRAQYLAT